MPPLKPTRSDFGIKPALAPFATFLDANKAGAGFREGEWTDPRRLLQTVHGGVDCRDSNRRAAAAIHLFVEVAENHAGGWQKARTRAHDFGYRNVDVAISNYGARTNDQLRLQSYGVQGPGIGHPVGLSILSCPKKYTFVKCPFSLFDIVWEMRKIKIFATKA